MVGNWLGMELPFIKNHKESYDEDTVLQPFSQELGHHDYCHAHVELLCFEEYLGDCSACVPIHAILFLYDSDGWDDVGVVVCSPDVKHNADDDLVASPERPALAGFEPWVVYTSPGALQPEQTFASERHSPQI